MSEHVHFRMAGADWPGVAVVAMDDGKANAMQRGFLDELAAALDQAESDGVHGLVLEGRPAFFSGGLDLKVLPDLAPEALRAVTNDFGEAMRRVFLFPKPIVAAAAGHAIAGGMMLYLAADVRLALRGTPARFGLNEAVTGIPLLGGTAGICQAAIPPQHHTELILHGRLLDAEGTRARGITHELVDEPGELLPRALARAAALRDVDLPAYATNKRMLREPAWRAAVERAEALMAEAPRGNVFERIRR